MAKMDQFFLLCGAHVIFSRKTRRTPRRFWENTLAKRRKLYGLAGLMKDVKVNDIGLSGEMRSMFYTFCRMTASDFELLINLVAPAITRKVTYCRTPLSVEERLSVTLRFLATGDSYKSLFFVSGISPSSLSGLIPETCAAIKSALSSYVKASN